MVRLAKGNKKPEKIQCEICGEGSKSTLHYHHIIPRTDPLCTHGWLNVAVICSNCHNKTHDDRIKIIGIFPSTQKPYGRTLIYEIDGVCNVPGIDEAYYTAKPAAMRIFNGDKCTTEGKGSG